MINEEIILKNLEKFINDEISYSQINEELKEYEKDKNKSEIDIIKRTINSYCLMQSGKSNGCDFFANLRQLINTFKIKFKVGNYINNKYEKIKNVNLYLHLSKIEEGKYLIDSKDANFNWLNDDILNDFKNIFKKKTITSKTATGDYKLKKMTGFDSYKSSCQKFIIKALENQRVGTTILATMRTGGGKSLLFQYISKYENKGTTIVVLPTIALTMDQYESSSKFFNEENRKVYAYYEGVSDIEKKEIFNSLINNKVAILYISPEAILNGMFYNKIMECAEKGILNRIVIDEAHLVSEWGTFFRTEFQFLAVFRRKILRLTNNGLKTLLLSATITERNQEVLKTLYSEKNNFIEIRGDSLRDEISFYKISCRDDYDRIKRIKQIIPLLPKPIIIYVSTIELANKYYNLAKEELGFYNVKVFTSKTSTKLRAQILKEWNEDKIDIIIATSAFGMGVDKKEVRSIIHAFIPESMDRFYQEVGRSGRDGYKSFSFLFTSLKEDKDYIKYLTRSKVLSTANILERWESMIKNPYEKISGNEYWLSVNTIPKHLYDKEYFGGKNESWNEYVLLFFYRKGFIDILDIRLDESNKSRLLYIKIKEIEIMNNKEKFENLIKVLREKERSYVEEDKNNILSMIQNENICWGKNFEKIYKYTEAKCSGCPVCRKKKINSNIGNDDYFEIVEGNKLLISSFNVGKEKIKKLVINLENNIINIIKLCKNEKIENLILPNEQLCKKVINSEIKSDMFLYTYEEALNIEEAMLRGNVAIVLLSNNNEENDKLFRKYNLQYEKDKIKKLIYISEQDVYIKSQNRNIEMCIDNISYIGR